MVDQNTRFIQQCQTGTFFLLSQLGPGAMPAHPGHFRRVARSSFHSVGLLQLPSQARDQSCLLREQRLSQLGQR